MIRACRCQSLTGVSLPASLILTCSLDLSVSHYLLTITCTCCYDETKGTQDLKICSHAHSLILTVPAAHRLIDLVVVC